jgi:thiosulfate/3-mercaptopyruvate sulfurtransferase
LVTKNLLLVLNMEIDMTRVMLTGSIISVQWLQENLSAENLIVFDASVKIAGQVANPTPETPTYIPGALRFDIDEVLSDHNTFLPHMMPPPEFFAAEMQKSGVNNDSAVVVYDKIGIFSSPRAWWMFRTMGHDQVAVLDGGLPAWIRAGHETVATLVTPGGRGNFTSRFRSNRIVDSKYVLHALSDSAFSVIDARSAGRFTGREQEPRPGLRGGHMPNAVNLPYTSVLEQGSMSPESTLQKIFESYKDKKMIFTCGSGITACVLALAAEQAGFNDLTVYDGSWSEWGQPNSGLPVVKE